MSKPARLLTICGLSELGDHCTRRVTHVLSILDPGWPDPDAFGRYDPHHRTTLRFHDVIEPGPGLILPERHDVAAILAFGAGLAEEGQDESHLLVHCHMGISRSTAALVTLLAQLHPEDAEDALFDRLTEIRPQAWPNSRMIGFADGLLGRQGRLNVALGRLYARQLARLPDTAHFMRTNGRAREVEMAGG